MAENDNQGDVLGMTAAIVSAHVSNNSVAMADLPRLIGEVYSSLSKIGTKPTTAARPAPAVSIKRSVHPDYIVCLEDGRKLKMLRRHLMTVFKLTPEAYRERWGLPRNYPMVAPNYAKARSRLAKRIGLGKN